MQAWRVTELHICFHAIGKKRSAAAKKRHAFSGGITPQHAPIGFVFGAARVTVVNHAGGAAEQAAELRVPHDPTGGRIPEKTFAPRVRLVTAGHIVMQVFMCQTIEHSAAMVMYQGLGQTGSTAGIDDPQGMIES